jgi:hypothetical protein
VDDSDHIEFWFKQAFACFSNQFVVVCDYNSGAMANAAIHKKSMVSLFESLDARLPRRFILWDIGIAFVTTFPRTHDATWKYHFQVVTDGIGSQSSS